MKYLLKFSLLTLFVFIFFQTNSYSQSTKTDNPCAKLSKIKSIPYKPSDVSKTDPEYKEYFIVVDQGENAIPCLIENILNTEEMDDPRCPSIGTVSVGDVAYFILQDIAQFDFTEMFSEEMKKAYKTDGIYGYYSLIDENGNRLKLQTKVKEWYSSKNQINK